MASAVIGALRVNLGIDTAAFSNGLNQAGSKLSTFGATLRKAIVPLAAVGAAAAIAVGNSVRVTVNAADDMSKAAQKFGIPIEELSRLKYAADLSDVSLQTLGTGVGRLSKNMSDAAAGSKTAVAAFDKIGVSFQNADGSLRSTTDVLKDIANVVASMPEGAAKTALGVDLMGKSWKELIPLLNTGGAALAETMAEADTFGQVFTAEMGTQAEQFNDNLTRLGGTFGNLAADLTQKLLPYLAQFTDWLVVNSPAIVETAGKMAALGAAVVNAGQTIAAGIKIAGDEFARMLQFAADLGAGIAQFVLDAETALNGFAAAAAAKIAEVGQAFLGLVEELKQIGRDVIDGLLAGLRERWEAVKEWFAGLAGSIPGWIRDPLGIQSPSTVFAEIGRNLMDGLTLGLASGRGGVQNELLSTADDMVLTFGDVTDTAGGAFSGFVQGLIKGSADAADAIDGLADSLGNMVLGRAADQIFGGVMSGLGLQGFASGTANTGGTRGQVRGVVHGQEAVIPLPRGGGVPVEMRGGGGGVVVNLYGAPPGTEVEERTGSGGTRQIQIYLRDQVKGLFARGELDGAMRQNFGMGRQPRDR